ncbi:MAG: aminotransferase class V-fold PLP-dependent enzyme [Micavibrio sp.]|nr:aminotransferase class V-fold PLP-dependent enzyme [Micavibrio sp.]
MFQSRIDRAAAARLWDFGGIDYLNHGSFGACPLPVQQFLHEQQQRLLQSPVDYFIYESAARVEENRLFWAGLAHADAECVVPVDGATTGVNTVLTSLALRGYLKPGDEILITSHGYNACNNAARAIAAQTGAVVTVATLPFPVAAPEDVTVAILAAVTPRTRLALVDHITSISALVLPLADIVNSLKDRGVETLVDGAHAPAQLQLGLDALGAAFYTGNGHKWLCAAPGAAFLYVRPDFHDTIRPLNTSHGANDPDPRRSALLKTFAWQGTRDTTPWMTPKVAHATLSTLHKDGLPALMADNRELLLQSWRMLLDSLNQQAPAPDSMTGTMATIILPAGDAARLRHDIRQRDNIVTQLVPLNGIGGGDGRALRISAHAYNSAAQFDRLAAALARALAREKKGDLLPLPTAA